MLTKAMGWRATAVAGVGLASLVVSVSAASAASSDVCSKVSPSAISAIVGHSVPAGVASTMKVAATKKNDGISAVQTTCTYGALTNPKAIGKVVILETETTSKSLTYGELKAA